MHCGKCLEVCPLMAATGREEFSARAKFVLAKALSASREGLSEKAVAALAGKCLSCGKCREACPFKLDAPGLVAGLAGAHQGFASALWGLWMRNAGTLWPMLTTLSRVLPRLGPVADLKAMDQTSRLSPWLVPVRAEACGQGRKAVVFPGCVASHARPAWTRTTLRLLGLLGFAPAPAPPFACCGFTLGSAGLLEARALMRRKNLEAWRAAGRPEMVTFCATCRFGLAAYASDASLDWAEGEPQAWSAAITGLADLAGRVTYDLLPGAPDTVHYHAPCHGAGCGADREFLRAAAGGRLSARTAKDMCCGFGGALKLGAPELSAAVGARCVDFYGPRPGEQILTGCSGCVIQLRAHAPAQTGVGHWLDIIG